MDKKQFKEMTIKQKLRWFFGYYGVTVIVAAIAIFVAVVFIKTVFGPSDLEDLCVLVYSDTVSQEQCISYEEEIEDSTGKTASVTAYNITDPYGSQAFATKIWEFQKQLEEAICLKKQQIILIYSLTTKELKINDVYLI